MAGTLESCYAFLSLEYCGILIFVRGLARGRVDGFSIGRYEEKRVSFDLNAAKFESGAMRFSGGGGVGGGNRTGARALSKQRFLPCHYIIRNSKRQTQNPSKSLKKPLLS